MDVKKQDSNTVVSFNEKSLKKRRSKDIVIAALSLLVIIAVAIFILLYTGHLGKYSCKVKYTKSCAISDANAYAESGNIEEFSKAADKIYLIPNYDNNPDLMYIVTVYSIKTGDADAASANYAVFEKLYTPGTKLDPRLNGINPTPFELRSEIEFLTQRTKEVQQNSWGITQDGKSQLGGKQ